MNFSLKTKTEIMKREFTSRESKISALSGFLRTSGSVESRNNVIGFSLQGEVAVLKYIAQIIKSVYGVTPEITSENDSGKRATIEMVSKLSTKILQDCKIISLSKNEISVQLTISDELFCDDESKCAYIVGAFLGSGTVTVPKVDNPKSTSYHLQIVFSQYVTATEFCELFGSIGFMPKLIERKDCFVVYLKNAEAVNDALTYFGATNSSLDLTDIIMRKELRNRLNRNINCEMSNMNKAINSAVSDRETIKTIEDTIGLDSLKPELKAVAVKRCEDETKSLAVIADELNITKSCLTHRLRKIRRIALDLS